MSRLQDVVQRHDRTGERMIAIGLAVLAGIVLAFHLVSAARHDWQTFNVAITLSLGSLIGLSGVRFWMASWARLPEILLGAVAAVEVAILFLMIWFYQYAYDIEAAGVLKSPTIVLLFAWLVLRTLRFDIKPVLMAGAFLAIGWSALVFAVHISPGTTVTYSFAEYITKDAFLLGAEIEKIIGFIAVAAILTFVVHRAHKLISRSAHVDDLKEALRTAEAANQTKDHFLGNMSHELRTPLNAIIGFSSLLLCEPKGPLGDKQYKAYVADIEKSGQKLLAMIEEIFDFVHLSDASVEYSVEILNLESVVEECCACHGVALMPVAAGDDGSLQNKWLPGNQVLIRRLFGSVFELAKNTAGSEKPFVQLQSKDGALQVAVHNFGSDLSSDDIAVLLEPFRSDNPHRASTQVGVSLELSLARLISERHGGAVLFVQAEDQSNRIDIRLPVFETFQAAAASEIAGGQIGISGAPVLPGSSCVKEPLFAEPEKRSVAL